MAENKLALKTEMKRTISALSEAFSSDLIDVDEFEARMDKAHLADSCDTLLALRADLVLSTEATRSTALIPKKSREVQVAVPEKKMILSILSGTKRTGQWRVPQALTVRAIVGEITLDFREAVFQPGVTEVKVLACVGSVHIIVPPELFVECDGISVLGEFESLEHSVLEPSPEMSILRISGSAILGHVAIQDRYAGESKWQAKRRRKRDRMIHKPPRKQLK